jgi:tetratricopeptide (TPR) repeat protein
VVHALRDHTGAVTGVAFSPDGSRLASASADQTVRVWDVSEGRECLVLKGHEGAVTGVAFSPDGSRLATASADHTLRIWNASDGHERLVLHGHTDAVTGVAFHPDGHQLASASADQTVRVWETASGQQALVLRGHTDAVLSLAYSPRGDRIASASHLDHTVRLWDAATGQLVLALRHDQVLSVAFGPDGQHLATGGPDIINVWDAGQPEPEDPWLAAAWFQYHVGQQQWARADAALARAERRLPEEAPLWGAAANVYLSVSRWGQAAHAYSRALQRGEENSQGYRKRLIFCHGQQGLWDQAIGEYTEVLRQEPANASLWRGRGDGYRAQGKYREAAADYRESSRLDPNPIAGYWASVASVAGDDREGYRRACAAMVERCGKCTAEDRTAWVQWTTLSCVLLPDAVPDLGPLVNQEEQLDAKAPRNWHVLTALGAALYRAGRFEAAIRKLDEARAVHQDDGNARTWFFLALAHQRLGHADTARRWRDKAVRWFERAAREQVNDFTIMTPLEWTDRVVLEHLRREADTLIPGGSGPLSPAGNPAGAQDKN